MSTITEGLEVRTAKVEMQAAGKKNQFHVADEVEVAFGPMCSPVGGMEHHVSALLATGLLTKKEDYFSADTFSVNVGDLRFAYPGRNAIAFNSTWRGP